MKKPKLILSIMLLLVVIYPLFSQEVQPVPAEKPVIKRYCIVIGCNKGNKERKELKYAVSDALHMKRVLEKMGGVFSENCILLKEPDRESFFGAFDSLRRIIIADNNERSEVIIYYSGHSDDRYLLLGDERVSYYELRMMISEIKATVRIAILDSCASGAFTRLKGGKKRPAFLFDEAFNMEGYAFMSSSKSTEASQESDQLGGSYFTHNLVAGLRGAADGNGDLKVTLNEVYQYAHSETLSQTTKTQNGPQHPSWNLQMQGTGDVVMTDIRNSDARLVLTKELSGKLFIHDSQDYLVMELRKHLGKQVSLGLSEGKYRLTLIKNNKSFEYYCLLSNDLPFEVDFTSFRETDRQITNIRGNHQRLFPNLNMKLPKFRLNTKGVNIYMELNYHPYESHSINQTLTGATFGFIFKKKVFFGIGGYGNISLATKTNTLSGLDNLAGYGGFEFGYFLSPIIRLSAMVGGGAFINVDSSYVDFINMDEKKTSPFFFLEPKISFIINLQKKFSVIISYSKRWVDGDVCGNFEGSKIGFGLLIKI